MSEKLKPCPACSSEPVVDNRGDVGCKSQGCLVALCGWWAEPVWQRAPRRDDQAPGMSDGELIARAIHDLANELHQAHSNDGAPFDVRVTEELSRREALRKPTP